LGGQDIWERIWVDQLCIDQSNNDERSSQIQLLKDIYRGRRTCYSYLGEEDEYVSLALAYAFGRLDDESSTAIMSMGFDEKGSLVFINYGHDIKHLPASAPDDDGGERALSLLYDRPYFERGWILQEVIISSVTMGVCGQYAFPLSTLWEAHMKSWSGETGHNILDLLKLSGYGVGLRPVIHPAILGLLWRLAQTGRVNSERFLLFDLVSKSRILKAGDQRDKIYSHLSLAVDRDLYLQTRY
jgi:hypothetical protein